MHKYIALVSLAMLLTAGAVSAQEGAAIAPEEVVTIQDLGVPEPTVLPTSPFYFFKEMGRGVQSLFTFNPVAKAELELKIANEKAAEVKKITETQPQNTQAIQKALENYQKTQEKLRVKFEGLKETSQNPKLDELLNKLTDRTVKHEKLFDEISFRFGDKEAVSRAISNAKAGSEKLIGEASKKDDPAKFASRLEKVLLEEKGGELKHARSVEIIDRFSDKTPEAVKESLERLREEFSGRLEADIKDLVEKDGEDVLKEKLGNTPGDLAKRSVIIEEIQKRAEDRLAQALEKARQPLEEMLRKELDINQKAKEQIAKAEQILQEAEKKIAEAGSAKVPDVVATLLGEAKENLAKAKSAFEEEKYGEAFGQARSAEVLARNALRFFEREKPQTENFEQHLKELAEKINVYERLLKKKGYTEESNAEAFALLKNAVLHLGYAKEAFANDNMENTKLHISHARDFLTKLARIVEGKMPEVSTKTAPPTIAPVAVNCEEITKRIIQLKELLASKGITEADFKIKYDSHLRNLVVCQERKNATIPLPPVISPAPVPTHCTQEYDPVCTSSGAKFSNPCLARVAGVTNFYPCGIIKIETNATEGVQAR